MKGQEKRKLIETDDKPSRTFEYQNDEPQNQTSGIILNANISNKNYLKATTKKNSLFSDLAGVKSCLCCAENIAESLQSKKMKYPLLGESNTKMGRKKVFQFFSFFTRKIIGNKENNCNTFSSRPFYKL